MWKDKPKKDLIRLLDLSSDDINYIFDVTEKLKCKKIGLDEPLKNKNLALIFQKPSNRTRVSFEVGMHQLGGDTIYLGPEDIKLGVRESSKDIAKVLSRYVDVIVVRTFSNKVVEEIAEYSSMPVINGLSDLYHPCQGLADIFTIKEKFGSFKNIQISYVGDGNNVLNSLMVGASILGLNLNIATPKKYEPNKNIVSDAMAIAKKTGASIKFSNDPVEAVKNSVVIYTDVWTSMGQEKEAAKRRKAFKSFQINEKLLSCAKKECLVMHCLPAHRGEEITDEVMDGPSSIVLDQAENRLHIQKALLLILLGKI